MINRHPRTRILAAAAVLSIAGMAAAGCQATATGASGQSAAPTTLGQPTTTASYTTPSTTAPTTTSGTAPTELPLSEGGTIAAASSDTGCQMAVEALNAFSQTFLDQSAAIAQDNLDQALSAAAAESDTAVLQIQAVKSALDSTSAMTGPKVTADFAKVCQITITHK